MDLNTFNDCLDRHGPELEHWPEAVRTEAEQLLAHSAEAADALADARTLANLLRAMAEIPAPAHLAGRISARATAADPWRKLIEWISGALWRPVLAAALPLAIGFALGMSQLPVAGGDDYLAAELGLLPFASGYGEPADER